MLKYKNLWEYLAKEVENLHTTYDSKSSKILSIKRKHFVHPVLL